MVVQILLAISELFGDSYLTHIMLPVFLIAVGDNGDLTFFPSTIQSKVRGSEFLAWHSSFLLRIHI